MKPYVIQKHGRLNKSSGVTSFNEVYSQPETLSKKSLVLLNPLADSNLACESPRVGSDPFIRAFIEGFLDGCEHSGPPLWDSELNVGLDLIFDGDNLILDLSAKALREQGSDLQWNK